MVTITGSRNSHFSSVVVVNCWLEWAWPVVWVLKTILKDWLRIKSSISYCNYNLQFQSKCKQSP